MATDDADAIRPDAERRFADAVKELRQAAGWSQEQLAGFMRSKGLEESAALTVSRLESGRRRVRLDEALVLAELFRVPIRSMVKQDETLTALVAMRETQRRYRNEILDFQAAVDRYRDAVREASGHAIDFAEDFKRRHPGLDVDAADALERFLDDARRWNATSAAEFAAEVEGGRGIRRF